MGTSRMSSPNHPLAKELNNESRHGRELDQVARQPTARPDTRRDDAILNLGQEIGDRILSRAAATSSELVILDACQGIRMNDGPSVDQIMICVPGDDVPARDYLNGAHD